MLRITSRPNHLPLSQRQMDQTAIRPNCENYQFLRIAAKTMLLAIEAQKCRCS